MYRCGGEVTRSEYDYWSKTLLGIRMMFLPSRQHRCVKEKGLLCAMYNMHFNFYGSYVVFAL